MIAFDTDVFTKIPAGEPAYSQRAKAIPREEQSVPIVVIEDILRGRLNAIRLAEAGKARLTIEQAYGWLAQSLRGFLLAGVESPKANHLWTPANLP